MRIELAGQQVPTVTLRVVAAVPARKSGQELPVACMRGRTPAPLEDVRYELWRTGRRCSCFIVAPWMKACGHRAAATMTAVHTAHRHNLDEWEYRKDALKSLSRGNTDYESMLAERWKAAHSEALRKTERRDRAAAKRMEHVIRRGPGARALPRANQ